MCKILFTSHDLSACFMEIKQPSVNQLASLVLLEHVT